MSPQCWRTDALWTNKHDCARATSRQTVRKSFNGRSMPSHRRCIARPPSNNKLWLLYVIMFRFIFRWSQRSIGVQYLGYGLARALHWSTTQKPVYVCMLTSPASLSIYSLLSKKSHRFSCWLLAPAHVGLTGSTPSPLWPCQSMQFNVFADNDLMRTRQHQSKYPTIRLENTH
jgi:hypothetical protein